MLPLVVLIVDAPAVNAIDMPNERIVCFPTSAHQAADGHWIVPIHGIVSKQKAPLFRRFVVQTFLEKTLQFGKNSIEQTIFNRRVSPFLLDGRSDRQIDVQLGSQTYAAGVSEENGHFRANLRLTAKDVSNLLKDASPSKWVSYKVVSSASNSEQTVGGIQFVEQHGISIISDIDDTIKDTNAVDRKEMLANTFTREFRAVRGMPTTLRRCADYSVAFHYVSGSPWQLFEPLSNFLDDQRIPQGSFHLRKFKLSKAAADDLLASQIELKMKMIVPILTAYPRRRFVLVGDSGQQDPEIYGQIARSHADQVAAIYIRNLENDKEQGDRWNAAFSDVPKARWRVFENLGDMQDNLVTLMARMSKVTEN